MSTILRNLSLPQVSLGRLRMCFLRNEPSLLLLEEPPFSLLESGQGSSKLFTQFCNEETFVNIQLVPFDPELTHTKRLCYNRQACQALMKVVFPSGLMDPYLFCSSPAVS